jgi:hypothetical protein
MVGTLLMGALGVWAGDPGADPKTRSEGAVDLKAYRPDGTFLSETEEEDPGWYINVNWDDDDKDGWNPDDHSPGATYTPDKDDALVSGNGCAEDDDLWKFTVEIVPSSMHGPVKLTFDNSKVKVYRSRTKANPFSSGDTVNFTGEPITLYMEGIVGTQAFRSVQLNGTYVGSTPNIDPDKVLVTVFEVTLNGFFSGPQQSDCEKKHKDFGGSNNRDGKISLDDADGNGTTGDPVEFSHFCGPQPAGTSRERGISCNSTSAEQVARNRKAPFSGVSRRFLAPKNG